ncbi:hypothetical protein [Xenophilus azovorans]|uniref:hypothetical protein n=1 Tax=Xenophilus azovorans TaxID=151755 RepID=UPI00056EF270|nr:hypothetical protein [Xenophilus azovorans]
MSQWKDALCLLAIFAAYGLAGHLDYEDAVAMEEAMREETPSPCVAMHVAAAELDALHSTDVVSASLGTPAPAVFRDRPAGRSNHEEWIHASSRNAARAGCARSDARQ